MVIVWAHFAFSLICCDKSNGHYYYLHICQQRLGARRRWAPELPSAAPKQRGYSSAFSPVQEGRARGGRTMGRGGRGE